MPTFNTENYTKQGGGETVIKGILTIDGTLNIGDGSSFTDGRKKVYVASLNQSGTDAPIATELDNTLGSTHTLVWSRLGVGQYRLTDSQSNDPFTAGQTALKTAFVSSTMITGGETWQILLDNPSFITLQTSNAAGTLSDDLLQNSIIEIEVWQ